MVRAGCISVQEPSQNHQPNSGTEQRNKSKTPYIYTTTECHSPAPFFAVECNFATAPFSPCLDSGAYRNRQERAGGQAGKDGTGATVSNASKDPNGHGGHKKLG